MPRARTRAWTPAEIFAMRDRLIADGYTEEAARREAVRIMHAHDDVIAGRRAFLADRRARQHADETPALPDCPTTGARR